MGFASSGACFPTQSEALIDWCAHVEPGDTAMSCSSCNPNTSTCSITYVQANSPSPRTAVKTIDVSVSTPACDVPTPVNDALAYSSAIILLWAAVWAAKQVYNLFRVPHADGN